MHADHCNCIVFTAPSEDKSDETTLFFINFLFNFTQPVFVLIQIYPTKFIIMNENGVYRSLEFSVLPQAVYLICKHYVLAFLQAEKFKMQ